MIIIFRFSEKFSIFVIFVEKLFAQNWSRISISLEVNHYIIYLSRMLFLKSFLYYEVLALMNRNLLTFIFFGTYMLCDKKCSVFHKKTSYFVKNINIIRHFCTQDTYSKYRNFRIFM